MASLRPGRWALVVLLLFQPCRGKMGAHLEHRSPTYQRMRRLDEQFQQFKAVTQARLDMMAQNQNQNSSSGLESKVQNLADQYHKISLDLVNLKQTTTQEVEALREVSRTVEKKSKRIEGRLALLESNLRAISRRHTQKQKANLDQNLSNFTLELQGQDGRLASLELQREGLLVGVKRLQGSLRKHELRMSQLEERVGEILQGVPVPSDLTPQEDLEPRRGTQTSRGQRPGMSTRVLGRYRQSQTTDSMYSQSHPQTPAVQSRSQPDSNPQAESISNQPKRSKVHFLNKTPKTQTESPPQRNLDPQTHPDYKPNFQPQAELYPRNQHHPQHQYQHQYQHQQQHQRNPHPHSLPQQPVPYSQYTEPRHQPYPPTYPNTNPRVQGTLYHQPPPWPQHHPLPQPMSQTQPKHTEDRQTRTRPRPTPPRSNQKPDLHPPPQSATYRPQVNEWGGGEEEEREVGGESAEIQNFLQLPVRQKIPAQPVPRKDASICNVDSMLLFPSASAQNYVTFSRSFPDLPELSVCVWLRVEAGLLGTVLSYATDDNDNQLVLYGRNSSSSSSSFSPSYSSSQFSPIAILPSSLSTSQSNPSSASSLDFVVGDPVYRRLPTGSLLDGDWHHLCLLWSSIQGRLWHYADRRLVSSGSNFQKGWEVPGGGSVVLGQEQDTVGGGFDPAEGFAGRMSGFTVWDRVLSSREVQGVAEGKGVPRGVVLGMDDIKEVHGEVKQVACECLEHCV